MTKKEKDLLLKDLCGRLLYGVKGIRIYRPEEIITLGEIIPRCQINPNVGNGLFCEIGFDEIHDCCTIADFKPYLRSMSNMTDEEKDEYLDLIIPVNGGKGVIEEEKFSKVQEFYNSHHLDYNGLIPKGLALEAPEGMYKTE